MAIELKLLKSNGTTENINTTPASNNSSSNIEYIKGGNLPILYLEGDISPIFESKDNEVELNYAYGDRKGTCKLKGQGSSSYKMAKAFIAAGRAGKFNYTIKFDNAFEAKERTIYEPKAENNRWFHSQWWGAQKKYCLKANWIDTTHSRNVVSAKIWGGIVKSRANVNSALTALPCGGAVDGFPVVIMLNNEFHGLYTFNIPKDGWMLGLVEDSTKTQAMLGANDHELATQFKGELAGDESDFELEFVSDEDNADWVTPSLNRLINACINSNGADLDTTVAQYLDWDSAIDYYIYTVVIRGEDMVDKNFLITTFDGTKWFFTAYDMDSTYGLSWDASQLNRPVSDISFDACASTSRVFELIKRFKTNALKARYAELRKDILSESRIAQIFENFAWDIPSPILAEDVKKYPTIRGSSVNGIDQICRWLRQRLVTVDAWVDALPAQETPVEPEETVTNWVERAIGSDGQPYNNGLGYKTGTRLNSSGEERDATTHATTGFIEYTDTAKVIGIKGINIFGADSDGQWQNGYTTLYDENFVKKGHAVWAYDGTPGTTNGIITGGAITYKTATTRDDFTITLQTDGTAFKYIRISGGYLGGDVILTIG